MLKLEVKTRLSEEQLKQRIKSFFKDDLRLNITAEASDRVTFARGGYVTAVFSRDPGRARDTRVRNRPNSSPEKSPEVDGRALDPSPRDRPRRCRLRPLCV